MSSMCLELSGNLLDRERARVSDGCDDHSVHPSQGLNHARNVLVSQSRQDNDQASEAEGLSECFNEPLHRFGSMGAIYYDQRILSDNLQASRPVDRAQTFSEVLLGPLNAFATQHLQGPDGGSGILKLMLAQQRQL